MENKLLEYKSIIADIKEIIVKGRKVSYEAVSKAMIMTYWNIGKRIVEEEQRGELEFQNA